LTRRAPSYISPLRGPAFSLTLARAYAVTALDDIPARPHPHSSL
jgi:hypothetical protein